MTKVGIVGGGALGGAAAKGFAGSPHQLWMIEPDASKHAAFSHVTFVTELPQGLDLVLIAVKPALVLSVCSAIAAAKPKCVVSLANAVPATAIREKLGPGPTLYRAVMSTAAAHRMTTTTLCLESGDKPEWLDNTLQTLGEVVFSEEKLLDAIMAVSASAPAFFLAAAEGLADGGVRLGLTRQLAETLAIGAMRSAIAVGQGDLTPAKYRITSPGGTTIEGLAVLERNATKAAFSDAAVACVTRTRELQGSSK